jgi:hypothetical protein
MTRIFEIAGFAGICWLLWRCLARSDGPVGMRSKLILTLALIIGEILFVAWMTGTLHGGEVTADYGSAFLVAASFPVLGFIMSIIWTPQIANGLVNLLLSGFDGSKLPPQVKAYYSSAIAKRKRHKPLEAVDVVREHLAKNPDDFDGVMLLASIQADDLKDLSSAEKTLNHFCEWDQAPAEQVAAALAQLTDWRLKFYQEVSATKAGLQRVVEKYPGTPAAIAARERIASLGGTDKAAASLSWLKAALQRMIDRYPGTVMAVAARERIAQLEWVGGLHRGDQVAGPQATSVGHLRT